MHIVFIGILLLFLLYSLLVVLLPSICLSCVPLYHVLLIPLPLLTLELLLTCLQNKLTAYRLIEHASSKHKVSVIVKIILKDLNFDLVGLLSRLDAILEELVEKQTLE